MKRTVELLAPAGNMECLRAAVNAGADAIYIGGDRFGARAYAENFDQEALCEALDYAHLFGRRVYLTLNTLLKEEELLQIPSYVSPFYEAGLDGVIVQDFGVVRILKKYFADLELHASTQMTVTGADGARLLREQGICRVVPARELSLQEIVRIKQEAGVEVEAFIHGAMCYCYSGQCLFSSFLGGRSGNRGRCAGPCRLPYDIVGENGRVNSKAEQYPLSLKDLGVLPILPKLIGAGIDSFKIEGRMKSPEYVAGVTSIYRKYIDLYMQDQSGFAIEPDDLHHLKSLYTRGAMETGYYERQNGRSMVTLSKGGYENAVSAFGREMKERYVDVSRKLPLWGRAVLHIGEPARLTLETAGAPGGTEPPGQLVAGRGDARFEAVGDTAVQEAQNCPVQEADIKKQLFKTGNTVFEIRELIIEKDSKVFLPNKELSGLRRDALEGLTKQLLAPYRRNRHPEEKCGEGCGAAESHSGYGQQETFEIRAQQSRMQVSEGQRKGDEGKRPLQNVLTVSVTTYEQLRAVCACAERLPVRRLYVPQALFHTLMREYPGELKRIRPLGMACYLAFPAIVREGEKRAAGELLAQCRQNGMLDQIDGFLVNNLESLAFLQRLSKSPEYESLRGKKLQSDYGLYAFNAEAYTFLKELGIDAVTLPLEWSRHELAVFEAALPQQEAELVVYGYLPLMETANCIYKTMKRCRHGEGKQDLYLTDRYQKRFYVLTDCENCKNTILNSVPLSLHKEAETLGRYGNLCCRLRFTVESGRQTQELTEQFMRLPGGEQTKQFTRLPGGEQTTFPPKEFTTGHFRKGVL